MPTNQQVLFELVNKRTRNAKHFALADGTFQAVINSVDVHFQDDSGNWFNINTDLNDEADFDSWDLPVNRHGKVHFENAQGKSRADKKANKLNRDNYDYQALQVPYYAKIPRNFKRGYSVGIDDTLLVFTPVGASPSKGYVDTDNTNSIHYQDAWNDADVRLDVNWNGVKETIILKTDRAPSSFSFKVDGPLADDLTAGGLSLSPAWLVDANGTQRDVTQTVRKDASGNVFVDMVADVTGLVYPITIDPTVTVSTNDATTTWKMTWMDSQNPSSAHNGAGVVEAGYYADKLALVQPDVSSIPTGATILSATLSMTENSIGGVSAGTSETFNISTVNSTWTETSTSYNTRPTTGQDANYPTVGQIIVLNSGLQIDGINVTNPIRAQVNGVGYGAQITCSDVGYVYWYTYHNTTNTPSLQVNYDLPPSAPTVTAPNGGETWNAQQTIAWNSAQNNQTTDIGHAGTDTQNNTVSFGSYAGAYDQVAELFMTPSGVSTIGDVIVQLENGNGSPYTISADIYTVSAGYPSIKVNSQSATASVNGGTLTNYKFTFPTPVPVTPGTEYALVITNPYGSAIIVGTQPGTLSYPNVFSGILVRHYQGSYATWGSGYLEAVIEFLAPSSLLTYQIDLSTDNGTTWNTIVSQTPEGATSYTYDFTNQPQSSTCLIRIRASDGSTYGPYDQSNGVFTIQHNQAPLAPTNLSPAGGTGLDRASVIRLSWQKNDPDGTSDPQSKFDLQYSIDAGTTWTTVTQTTINQYYDVAANTFPHGNVLWKVRTYDQSGVSGPYSAQATFLAGDKPATPTITSPTNNGTVGVSRPTIQWSSPDQAHYEAQVLKSADSSSLWDSGDVSSTNKAVTVGNDIANGTAIVIEVRVENSDGIWSDWASVNATISYTPPAIATVAANSLDNSGYVQIAITNQTPSGSQPAVAHNDIYRSPSGQDAWTRIATNIPQSATFQDYAVPSGQAHDYKVTAVGNNGTSSDSAVHTITPSLKGAWISLASDPEGTVHRFKYDGEGRSADHSLTATMMAFEGRTLPVADVADQETHDIKITVKCRNGTDDLAALRTLLSSKQTVLYRDGRGRKIYGFISALPEQDTQFGTNVDLTIQAVDYQEAV